MRNNLLVSALTALSLAFSAQAEESSALARIKIGASLPQANTVVSSLFPVAVDGIYRIFPAFGLGAHVMHSSGAHEFSQAQGENLAYFDLAKQMDLVLGSANYFFNFGAARIGLGAKAGALFYSEHTHLAAGAQMPDTGNSKRFFTFGPSIDVDLPIKGNFFATLGGEYLFSQSETMFGSAYAGLGYNF